MPKAFNEVPKRIYSAGRKEIKRLNNRKKELLIYLKDMKEKNKFLLKDKKIIGKLLREYQDEGEPYTILLVEHQAEIDLMKNSLIDLKKKFDEEQILRDRLNVKMVVCNRQALRCKELLSLERRIGSLEVLKKKLKKFTKDLDVKDESIKMYRFQVIRMREEHERESNHEEREVEVLKEKLMATRNRLMEIKEKYNEISKKICNTNHHHHHHHEQIEKKSSRKTSKKTNSNLSASSKNKTTRTKLKTKLQRVVASPKESLTSNPVRAKRLSKENTPSKEIVFKKRSSSNQLISPFIGVSCQPPQTCLKTTCTASSSIGDINDLIIVTFDPEIVTSDPDMATSDLGRSILTPDVSDEIDLIDPDNAPNVVIIMSRNSNSAEELSVQSTNIETPQLTNDDGQLAETSDDQSLIITTAKGESATSDDDKINDDKIGEQFKMLDINKELDECTDECNEPIKDVSMETDKNMSGSIRDERHNPTSNGRRRKQNATKSQLVHEHRSGKNRTTTQTTKRKVYLFNQTVEHLHNGTPTRSTRQRNRPVV